ncbi:glycoside hydrolase family 15 protein [Tessaracoccus antarcticus]|uniref:glycoside hydrolase family 15 protein n=1 Tax=Tessaracoccus antarcticus TaxID=2479848 RepID=UPI0018F6659C|nr:glycoside hydrolase family 15 protein [Tessaracoccus antarcticus]
MSIPIEEYALLSDLHTAALVSRQGSIDWLCFPRFDSQAVFAALLGSTDNGHWSLGVVDGEVESRRYVGDSCVLRTTWSSPTGRVEVTDYMPVHADRNKDVHDLVRRVRCVEGTATVRHVLCLRFDYGSATPYFRSTESGEGHEVHAVAGPDQLTLRGPALELRDQSHQGDFTMVEGDELAWVLSWWPSFGPRPEVPTERAALHHTLKFWEEWADRIDASGPYAGEIRRSLITLRALTEASTGGIVAAPTTSLPEDFGGVRNWDYRFVWLRDSALTIEALVSHGFTHDAKAWRLWLLRAIAGDPNQMRIMYGLGGERHLSETELDHLSGYEDSKPVRIGNGAAEQYQADVVGAVMVALDMARDAGIKENELSWGLQKSMLDFQKAQMDRKDHGIWEMRGETQFFTHGRAMMWAAFDRGVRAVERHGLDGPVETWRALRDQLRQEVLEKGWDEESKSFVQYYGSTEVDASLLQLGHIGFLEFDDPRMLSTVARIERELLDDSGFLHRYDASSGADGLTGKDSPFLICSFWLVEQYARSGRVDDARTMMDAVLSVSTDLGLLSEEYSPEHKRLAGNFPQAFSHLGLIRAADALDEVLAPHGRPAR